MTPPYLSDEEIAEICRPLTMPAAQRRHLARLGLLVKAKPNGQPLVARAEFERVMTGAPAAPAHGGEQNADTATTPNVVGLEQWARGRKRRGTSS